MNTLFIHLKQSLPESFTWRVLAHTAGLKITNELRLTPQYWELSIGYDYNSANLNLFLHNFVKSGMSDVLDVVKEYHVGVNITRTVFVANSQNYAAIGDIDALKKCGSFNERTCTLAAYHGHLDCMQYAHEHGAYWDGVTFRMAENGRHKDCLAYLIVNGCPTTPAPAPAP
jgi:hypothetical protein